MSAVNNGPQIIRNGLVLDLDASYIRSYSPNVMPNPTDIFAWAGVNAANAATLSRDTSMTRQYGSIPMKMAVTGNDPFTNTINYGPGALSTWNLAPAANGQTWTISVYVKASVATTGELFLMPADSNGVAITSYFGAISISTSWTRVSFTVTISAATTAFIQGRLDGPNSGGAGINIWWDGMQVERASSATTFNPYYISNSIWRDVSSNNRSATLIDNPSFSNTNGGIISFDGSTQYATTSNVALSFTTFSMECLVKYASLSGNQGLFTYNNSNFINLWKGSGVGMRWEVNSGGQAITGTNDLATGVWYHFVGVYDGSRGILYRNAVINAGPTTLTSHTSEAASFQIGRYAGAGNTNGNIAIAKFYTRALTAIEVSQNYEATKSRFGL